MWYPPVRRTLVCLSKLYRCLEREIFQGLSQEALTACMDSLTKAAAQIAAQKTAMDGQLFEIKHLLILREQGSWKLFLELVYLSFRLYWSYWI